MKRRKMITALYGALLAALPSVAQNWQHVGPLSNGTPGNLFQTGRLDCISPDYNFNGTTNQTLFAGSTSAGLWVTTDLAASWNVISIPDYVTYHGVTAIMNTPSGYFLVSTCNVGRKRNEYGNIYKYYPSTNTWTATNFATVAGAGSAYVNRMNYCPSNPSVVFAAASNGLYKSTDGGTTWTLTQSGNFEHVLFVQAAWATSGYEVYAGGTNKLIYSSDLGASFSTKTSVTSFFGATYYTDMALTPSASNPNIRYIYFNGMNGGNHHLVRLSLDINVQANQTVSDYGYYGDPAYSEDRTCMAAYDNAVYFGCGGLAKYNVTMGDYYWITNGADTSDVNFTTSIGYHIPAHADNHDMLVFPALNKMLYVNDGGCFVNDYIPGLNQVDTNLWAPANNGLHISQIWGLSCSDDDPNVYMTGEQDAIGGGFVTSAASTTYYAGGVEPSNVLIDRFNSNNYMHSSGASSEAMVVTFNGIGPVQKNYLQYPLGSVDICISNKDIYHYGPEFGNNTLFQDPNRPDKIYFGARNSGLFEFCLDSLQFVMKKNFLPAWNLQFVNGMAFSKANKNKVYVTISNRNLGGSADPPLVYAYTGIDFDDSWYNHNDNAWANITPSYSAAPFNTSVPQDGDIEVVGIAASDWNPDRIWCAYRYVAGNPLLKVVKREAGVWQDYSTGIPAAEVPVSLVYEQGTNDQLYLGTNVNVYYRDASMSSWMPYSGVLPNVAVNELRINYGDNTLRAGTYGRGMWSSDLRCPSQYAINESGAYLVDKFVEAEHSITATLINTNINTIIYRAGHFIDLLPTSDANPSGNVMFHAYIHDCKDSGNSFRAPRYTGPEKLEMDEVRERIAEHIREQFVIYPNPTDGRFYLERGTDTPADIEVYDPVGRLLVSLPKVTGMKVEIDLSGQPQGLYLLKLKSGDELRIERIIRR